MFGIFKKKPLSRKERSENILKKKGIKINYNLPHIEDESETNLRRPKEIGRRVSVLATVNLVAFNAMTGQQAIGYLKHYHLLQYLTPKEKEFLNNPTDELKNAETWKCEGIWVLLWALKVVDEIGSPAEMCDLNKVNQNTYPIGQDKDPNLFIDRIESSRSKTEILDANDLYYRLDWTCVDARINNVQLDNLHQGVVYERHYALNWLVNYMDQEWDDISCDT